MILGIGEAGYLPAGTAMLSDYYHHERRSRIMSWWSVSTLLGVVFGIVIGGIVAGLSTGSWRLAFLFTGIPGVILAFLAWRLREPRRNEADEARLLARAETVTAPLPSAIVPMRRSFLRQLRDLVRIKTLVVLTVMQVFALFVMSVAVVYLPIYLQQKDGFALSSGVAGAFSGGVIAVAGIIGTIGGGYLADLLNLVGRRRARAGLWYWLSSQHARLCGRPFDTQFPPFRRFFHADNRFYHPVLRPEHRRNGGCRPIVPARLRSGGDAPGCHRTG